MKGEKKLLVGVGTLLTVFTIIGWTDAQSLAKANDTASAKTEIIIGATESEITEATVKEHIEFELTELSIIEKDLQEKRNEPRIFIPITDSGEFDGDSVFAEAPDDNGSGTGGAEGNSERPASSGDRAYTSASDGNAEGDTGTVSAAEGVDTGSGRLADEAGLEDEGTGEEDNGTGTEQDNSAVSESHSYMDESRDSDEAGYEGSMEYDNIGFIDSELGIDNYSDMDESGFVESDTDYESESGSDSGNLIYLGTWSVTAYCPNACCCGQWATGYTASGTYATEGRTVACGSLPIGTEIYIEGWGYRTVEDLGVDGEWIDLFFYDHASASAFGLQYLDIYLVN